MAPLQETSSPNQEDGAGWIQVGSEHGAMKTALRGLYTPLHPSTVSCVPSRAADLDVGMLGDDSKLLRSPSHLVSATVAES